MAGIAAFDHGDRVLIRNGSNTKSTAMMWGDRIFKSQAELAEKAGITPSKVTQLLRQEGGEHEGKEVRFATIDEVKHRWPNASVATKTAPEAKRGPKPKPKKAQARPQAKKEPARFVSQREKVTPVFYGFEWPDGAIELRIPGNQDFSWILDSEDDIPDVFDGLIEWL